MELPPMSLSPDLLNPVCLPDFLIWRVKGAAGTGKLNWSQATKSGAWPAMKHLSPEIPFMGALYQTRLVLWFQEGTGSLPGLSQWRTDQKKQRGRCVTVCDSMVVASKAAQWKRSECSVGKQNMNLLPYKICKYSVYGCLFWGLLASLWNASWFWL